MPRQSNSKQRRGQITKAFMQVMAKHGYDGASVADIAKAAHLAPGLVHYYFKSKQQILLAALGELVARHDAALENRLALAGDDPVAEVEAFIDFHLGLGADADPEALACWILFSGEALRAPKVRSEFEKALVATVARIAAIIRAGAERRVFVCDSVDAAASALTAVVQGYFVLAATARTTIPSGSAAASAKRMANGPAPTGTHMDNDGTRMKRIASAKTNLQELSGIDHFASAIITGLWTAIGIVVFWVAPRAIASYVFAVVMIGVPIAVGARYRLRVSTEGIEFTQLIAWVLPIERLRYLLDAKIDIYQSLESDKPEGVYVEPVRIGGDEEPSPYFGPSFSQIAIASLYERANQAIQRARERLPPAPFHIRSPLLGSDTAKLRVGGSKRNWQNRIREVKVSRDLVVGPLRLPAGTLLEFNGKDYLDPRRDDLLIAAVANRQLRLPVGIDVPPETRIWLTPSGEVCKLRGKLGSITLDGFPIDGNAPIGFCSDGHLDAFTLGAETQLGGWTLPVGTAFSTWAKLPPFADRPSWLCRLGGRLRLPELLLRSGDTVQFDKANKALVRIYPQGEPTIDGKKLYGSAIQVFPDGRIDWKNARKAGILRP